MAYDGELVKMANGRWARFQRCQVCRPGAEATGEKTMMLIAVELDEHYQRLLDEVADSLAEYRQRGIPVQAQLDAQAQRLTLLPESDTAPAVH